MELLCQSKQDALSFREAMAYHRTNPLFDRIVAPFFVMLKHVALFQGKRTRVHVLARALPTLAIHRTQAQRCGL
jgi:hypothetical protein